MKTSLSAGHLVVALLSLTPAVSALAWPRWLPEIDALVVRADDASESPSPTPTPTAEEGSNDEDQQSTTKKSPMQPITTNLNTGGMTKTGTATDGATSNSTRTSAPKKTQFNPQDPAGGVAMITPSVMDGLQLYKIEDKIKWVWNYTNLQGKPAAIDVYIKCSKVAQPWTLTQNMSFAEPATFVWDTDAFKKKSVATPLLTEQYTLVIADSDGGISAAPEAGFLAPFSGISFGLYEKKAYHDNGDGYQCASCSGAMSGLDTRAVGVAMAMSAVTVLSFTWFVVGVGAFV